MDRDQLKNRQNQKTKITKVKKHTKELINFK